MAEERKKKKPDHVTEQDGWKIEWRSRRSCFEADVYDPSGKLVSELEYPRALGSAYATSLAFKAEALMIAQKTLAEQDK